MTIILSLLVRYIIRIIISQANVRTELEKKVGVRHVEDLSDFLSWVSCLAVHSPYRLIISSVRCYYCELPPARRHS